MLTVATLSAYCPNAAAAIEEGHPHALADYQSASGDAGHEPDPPPFTAGPAMLAWEREHAMSSEPPTPSVVPRASLGSRSRARRPRPGERRWGSVSPCGDEPHDAWALESGQGPGI